MYIVSKPYSPDPIGSLETKCNLQVGYPMRNFYSALLPIVK